MDWLYLYHFKGHACSDILTGLCNTVVLPNTTNNNFDYDISTTLVIPITENLPSK
jgi:hypothetical protein